MPWNLNHKKNKLQKSSAFSHPNPKSRLSFHSFFKKKIPATFLGSPHTAAIAISISIARHGSCATVTRFPSLQEYPPPTSWVSPIWWLNQPTQIWIIKLLVEGGFGGENIKKWWNKNSVNWSNRRYRIRTSPACFIFLAFFGTAKVPDTVGAGANRIVSPQGRSSAQLKGFNHPLPLQMIRNILYIYIYYTWKGDHVPKKNINLKHHFKFSTDVLSLVDLRTFEALPLFSLDPASS